LSIAAAGARDWGAAYALLQLRHLGVHAALLLLVVVVVVMMTEDRCSWGT
jgi:hypothetical protein